MDKCLLWKDGDGKYEYEGISLHVILPDELQEFTIRNSRVKSIIYLYRLSYQCTVSIQF